MSDKPAGKHIKQINSSQADDRAYTSANDVLAKSQEERRKGSKRTAIVILSVIAFLAVVYFGGVFFFSGHFMPNTSVSNINASMQDPDKVRSDVNTLVEDFQVTVKGNGVDATFSSSDAGLDIDSESLLEAMQSAQNPWAWPWQVFQSRDMTDSLADALSASKLTEAVSAEVAKVNAEAVAPESAKVQFDEASKSFQIIPETSGTQLDSEKVMAGVLDKVMALQTRVDVTDDMILEASYKQDDPKVIAAKDKANSLIGAKISLNVESQDAGSIDGTQISQWVSISPEYEVGFDNEAMNEWARTLSDRFDTIGSTRTYTRPDGKVVTVSGGDYGWEIDNAALISQIEEGITSNLVGALDVPVIQTGKAFALDSGKDWGNRYVDVDLTEQHARFYGDDGQIIWESDIVSGVPGGDRETPTGVYDVNSLGTNVTLVGRDTKTGKVTYRTPVSYWMPFVGNSIGFHDATWQSAFGGERYRTGYGSHGCINLSLGKAEELYGILQVDDVVVVHD